MTLSFKYWEDCVHSLDIEALWMDPQVRSEWLQVGETKGRKVHLSRDPDGEPFLTQTEIRMKIYTMLILCFHEHKEHDGHSHNERAIVEIVVRRHFHSQVDLDMICALIEVQSDRRLLATKYIKKTKETTIGLMQISTQIANWLVKEHGYRLYDVEEQPNLLYKPIINIYFGVAYVKCLSNFEQRERSEEFVVRAFSQGPKKATHKSTLPYWKHYLFVKDSLPSSNKFIIKRPTIEQNSSAIEVSSDTTEDDGHMFWDSRTSPEDMDEMWNRREVHKQWMKSREKRGKVRFSHDILKGFYLTRVELKAVAEIIISKHFNSQALKPAVLCALTEIISARYLNGGGGSRIGLMGLDYPTAKWLYKELGYDGYKVESSDDLRKPFVSMYFGAAYMTWLSTYEGRERSPRFVAKAYLVGPKNVNLEETCPACLKFEQELSYYGETKRETDSCTVI